LFINPKNLENSTILVKNLNKAVIQTQYCLYL